MSFPLPDLIVESVIRDGLANIKADSTILDDLFAEFANGYAARKYGALEIATVKSWISGNNAEEIAIIHAFHPANAKLPCISIQLGSDVESDKYLEDFEEDLQESITDVDALAALVKVSAFTPTGYDANSGMVSVGDAVDLSPVYDNYIFVDASDVEHVILNAISNETGNKFFFITPNGTPDIGGDCTIKTFLEYTQLEIKSSHQDVQLLLGVHTKNALTTKYLYQILKYILKSRRKSLELRGISKSTVSGSDFTQNMQYEGDAVFTRFLTFSGHILEWWRSDQVNLIDRVDFEFTAGE